MFFCVEAKTISWNVYLIFVSLNLILWYPLSFLICMSWSHMNEYTYKMKEAFSVIWEKSIWGILKLMNEAYLFIWYHNFQVIKYIIISATIIKQYNHKMTVHLFMSLNRMIASIVLYKFCKNHENRGFHRQYIFIKFWQ